MCTFCDKILLVLNFAVQLQMVQFCHHLCGDRKTLKRIEELQIGANKKAYILKNMLHHQQKGLILLPHY